MWNFCVAGIFLHVVWNVKRVRFDGTGWFSCVIKYVELGIVNNPCILTRDIGKIMLTVRGAINDHNSILNVGVSPLHSINVLSIISSCTKKHRVILGTIMLEMKRKKYHYLYLH